jgi:hypothetical protein
MAFAVPEKRSWIAASLGVIALSIKRNQIARKGILSNCETRVAQSHAQG